MKKTQAIRYLSLLPFGWLALAAPACADASPVNTQEWGVYASLAGTAWRGGYGQGEWDVSVEWREVGVELVERWEPGKKGYAPMTHVITRGARPGELRLVATNGVCASRTGTVRPDGTVLFVCDGFFKWPVHVVAPQAGVWEQRYVKLDGGEIAGVKDTWRFLPASGATQPALAAAAPTQGPAKTPVEASQGAKASPTVPAAEPVSPLAADWGVYAAIVDKDWRGSSNVSIRWNKPGEELVEKWTYGVERGERAGEQQVVATIRRGDKPGSLVATLEGGEIAGTQTLVGRVREDGSVQFSKPGLLLDQPVYKVSLPSPPRLEYGSYPHDYPPGNPPGNYKGTSVYLAQGDGEGRAGRERLTETWGAYADLAGKHWLVDDTPSGDKLLFTFGWIVPGEAMYVRMHNLAYGLVQNHHVVRSPETGKLYAEPSLWGSWKAEVTLDGDRSITLETKGMLGWRMSFTRKADGGFEYYEDPFGGRPYTGSMVAVSNKEAPRLIAAAKEAKVQREQEKQQRKRERREAFNSAMMVANSALAATSEALAQQQAEADAAQRRYQAAVMERNRVAAEREAAEAERKYQADWQHAKQVLADQEKAREARAEASRAEADRRQHSVAQSAQQQQQRRAEETRRREAAEAERKRQQEADAERRRREEIAQRERAERDMLARSRQLEEALKRQEEEARNRPVAYREGITLCAPPKNGGKAWLCRGPLQNMSGVLDTQSGNVAVRQACGGNNVRDLGMVAGYRAYGCGFGIHPTDRDYPGNRDIPASLGVNYVPDRDTFYCNPTQVFAYCKDRR